MGTKSVVGCQISSCSDHVQCSSVPPCSIPPILHYITRSLDIYNTAHLVKILDGVWLRFEIDTKLVKHYHFNRLSRRPTPRSSQARDLHETKLEYLRIRTINIWWKGGGEADTDRKWRGGPHLQMSRGPSSPHSMCVTRSSVYNRPVEVLSASPHCFPQPCRGWRGEGGGGYRLCRLACRYCTPHRPH